MRPPMEASIIANRALAAWSARRKNKNTSGSQMELSNTCGQPIRATNPPSEKQMPAMNAENRDSPSLRTSRNMEHDAKTCVAADQTW